MLNWWHEETQEKEMFFDCLIVSNYHNNVCWLIGILIDVVWKMSRKELNLWFMFKDFKADTESLFLLKSLEAEISEKGKMNMKFLGTRTIHVEVFIYHN